MKVFWWNSDNGNGVKASDAVLADVNEVHRIWYEDLSGVHKTFLGLIDDQDRTTQFYFDEGVPDHIDDAGPLEIIWFDFPDVEKQGSFGKTVRLMDVEDLINQVFEFGADPTRFTNLQFQEW